MTDKPFKIWRSDESLLIRFSTGEQVELSLVAAALLATGLSPRPERKSRHWTDERKEELRRLYEDERWTLGRLAEHFGLKGPQTMNSALRSLGIPAISQKRAGVSRARMIQVRARKRAAA